MEEQMNSSEARTAPRIPIGCFIKHKVEGTSTFERAELRDLSVGGAFLWVENPLPEGTRMMIIIDPDAADELPVQLYAEVQRTETCGETLRLGVGCKTSETPFTD